MYILTRDELVENIKVSEGSLDELRSNLVAQLGHPVADRPATITEVIDLASTAWGVASSDVGLIKA
ncbi:hypothetical protein [Corynebacterium sp. H130]|uniref:hypothetical protein n=1 Tax=Corynebacterium sp. H130 TaxID=3133444 RepID=UPI003097774F